MPTDGELRAAYEKAFDEAGHLAGLRAVAKLAGDVPEARAAYWRAAYDASMARHDVVGAEYEGSAEQQEAAVTEAEKADREQEEALANLRALGAEP